MSSLFEKIYDLQHIPSISKHEQIVHGIMNAIDAGVLSVGDKLPSINVMVAEIGYARKTIVKAYTELKERGLVESKNLKGYFIISQETNTTLKVALILFAFHSFQEDFYNTFRKELGKRFQIDIFFHHNNLSLFKTIMDNISRKYGAYVIAPIQDPEVIPLMETIPPDRLLIVDRHLKLPSIYSYITQEFEEITYNKLVELAPRLKEYDKMILFFKANTDLPKGILKAFQRFITDYNIKGEVFPDYRSKLLKKRTVFFTIADSSLWQILKDARKLEYRIGQDIGILAHDDNIVKEIAFGGISTISTDFTLMAKKAAAYVKDGNPIQETIPTYLRQRNSL
ncbi:GntR family transcriptional regulator [uncultured Dokdonia sp.]|uniref:GntR family transcriptional regulator n=1 Tax=uncultured Dokdonia sp. TaxID=575653 RepID=UPI00262E403A|nr:GntR family transcriptional regulator [uncultured Dokdonia sp.]